MVVSGWSPDSPADSRAKPSIAFGPVGLPFMSQYSRASMFVPSLAVRPFHAPA